MQNRQEPVGTVTICPSLQSHKRLFKLLIRTLERIDMQREVNIPNPMKVFSNIAQMLI